MQLPAVNPATFRSQMEKNRPVTQQSLPLSSPQRQQEEREKRQQKLKDSMLQVQMGMLGQIARKSGISPNANYFGGMQY